MTEQLTKMPGRAERLGGGGPVAERVAIGQWYWVTTKNYKGEAVRWLGCVTHVGSNYGELTSVAGGDTRVHFDHWLTTCEEEPNAEAIIKHEIETRRQETARLMGEVQDTVARLGVGTRPALGDGPDVAALTVHTGTLAADYKAALVLAKDKALPELFKAIEEANKQMGQWMKAGLIPLRARAEQLRPAIRAVEARIFNVELYAGLAEEIAQITDGAPAPMGETVYLFQRRAYMDEECLARYEAGGMELKDLPAFDAWMARPENRDRLLPLPRCVLAFQVRRHTKEREVDLSNFLAVMAKQQEDKRTFLYMRNGEQLYRLATEIDFGAQLFPDLGHEELSGTLYAKMFIAPKVDELITERHYKAMVAEEKAADADYKRRCAEAKRKGEEKPWNSSFGRATKDYVKWSPDSVYHDDIAAYVKKQIDRHNRLVVVLQGLMDRSPVFHPHPPVQLWTPEGFATAIRLVYDDARALVAGAKPDFEAYRARLNASLKKGSTCVGQEDYWERVEAQRYNANRRAHSWRGDYREVERHRPYLNPGPGTVAVATAVSKAGVTFRWWRERHQWSRYDDGKNLPCMLRVPQAELLHVDAYTPGDFHLFFDDPRTRADYLQWAPLLLAAEDWHAARQREERSVRADDATGAREIPPGGA